MNIQGLTPGNWIKEINRFDYDSNEPLSDLEFQIPEYASFIPYKGDSYQPITLTEEWLLKFGFEYGTISFRKKGTDLAIISNSDKWLMSIQSMVITKFKYVHQLQNLYFALTGEELNNQMK